MYVYYAIVHATDPTLAYAYHEKRWVKEGYESYTLFFEREKALAEMPTDGRWAGLDAGPNGQHFTLMR